MMMRLGFERVPLTKPEVVLRLLVQRAPTLSKAKAGREARGNVFVFRKPLSQ
jgi:hypothetical protein